MCKLSAESSVDRKGYPTHLCSLNKKNGRANPLTVLFFLRTLIITTRQSERCTEDDDSQWMACFSLLLFFSPLLKDYTYSCHYNTRLSCIYSRTDVVHRCFYYLLSTRFQREQQKSGISLCHASFVIFIHPAKTPGNVLVSRPCHAEILSFFFFFFCVFLDLHFFISNWWWAESKETSNSQSFGRLFKAFFCLFFFFFPTDTVNFLSLSCDHCCLFLLLWLIISVVPRYLPATPVVKEKRKPKEKQSGTKKAIAL